MLDDIARACRRWTDLVPVEMALVVPVSGSAWSAPVPVAIGDACSVTIPVRRVLHLGLALGSDGFVLAHSHLETAPPSADDDAVTRRLVAAAAVTGMRLHAHLVLTPRGWYDCLAPPVGLHAWIEDAAA